MFAISFKNADSIKNGDALIYDVSDGTLKKSGVTGYGECKNHVSVVDNKKVGETITVTFSVDANNKITFVAAWSNTKTCD